MSKIKNLEKGIIYNSLFNWIYFNNFTISKFRSSQINVLFHLKYLTLKCS